MKTQQNKFLKGLLTNKTSLIGMLFILSFAIIMIAGCASAPKFNGVATVQVIGNGNVQAIKTSKLTETVYLVFINPSGTTFPSIADTAKAGGIIKIATVEYYSRAGFLFLWTDYTTIVTGQ